MDAMELDKHLQIPMCSKPWWKIANLDKNFQRPLKLGVNLAAL